MSSRAIRALRGDPLLPPAIPNVINEGDADDSDEEEESARPGVFAFMNDDSSSEEEEESSNEDASALPAEEKATDTSDLVDKGEAVKLQTSKDNPSTKTTDGLPSNELDDDELDEVSEKEEDLDALLAEFQVIDESAPIFEAEQQRQASAFDLILDGFESRHLDYDFVMRTSTTLQTIASTQKRAVSFGPAHGDWRRPSRLVGGGMGMQWYDQDPRPVPFPYDSIEDESERVEWATFMHSDSVERDLEDFRLIQQSGDLNALGMFLIHHPYVPEALLQYSAVLYQTNRMFEGLSLLKRCLYLFESSALSSFWDRLGSGKVCFMDYDRRENQHFFRALFRLMQVSQIAGLSRTSLASCRLLLALDPLRDPMGILLTIDKQTLAVAYQAIDLSEQKGTLKWLIDLIESNLIQLYYKDPSLPDDEIGSLLDLPNWAYSYPLAIFLVAELERLDGHGEAADTLKEKADTFLKEAILRFPSVVPLLLQNLDVDTSGRSFQRDWVKVLDFAETKARSLKRAWQADSDNSINLSAAMQAMDRVAKIFVSNPSKQWATEDVIQWLFDTLLALSTSDDDLHHKLPPTPCIMRYSDVKVADFESRNELFPADANVMDPNVVAGVMAPMQAGRQRFLRRQQQQQIIGGAEGANRQQPAIFGPPRNALDLDWPMAEVFWRSFLPWNYIEGLPPPPR